MQSAAGQCNILSTVEGDSAHPEGFCQQTCNHCNNYCVPKNGKAAPGASSKPSSSSSSSGQKTPVPPKCSDNPPSKQFSCAQQVKPARTLCKSACRSGQVSSAGLVGCNHCLGLQIITRCIDCMPDRCQDNMALAEWLAYAV